MRTPLSQERNRVLVIEDNTTVGRHLDAGLRGGGYVPTWCRTGAGGLVVASRTLQDAVVLDLGLLHSDGVDVARRLRCYFPDLLIVILTASSEEADVAAGLAAGADDYLVKPVSLTELLARLRAHPGARGPA